MTVQVKCVPFVHFYVSVYCQYQLQASAPHKYAEERDLVAILQKPHIKVQ